MAGHEDIFQKAMNDGHSAAWDKNWAQAATAYSHALIEFPDSPKALNSFALAKFQLLRFDEALRIYIHAARVSPDDPLPFEKIALIYQRMGNLKEAKRAALYAAELYLKLHDVDKAVENWLNIIQLEPENLQAHSRLALIHEKTGQIRQASVDYIAVASILQNSGNPQKALEVLEHSSKSDPEFAELKQSIKMIKTGHILSLPMGLNNGTGSLNLVAVKELSAPPLEQIEKSSDPFIEARLKALKVFAEVLFDMEDDESGIATRRGLVPITENASHADLQLGDHAKIGKHLSGVIDAQTKGNEETAVKELKNALESGFNHPAAYFDLGLMLSKTNQPGEAYDYLQQCVKHSDYALATRLLNGKLMRFLGRPTQAAVEYLEALKIADSSVVDLEQVDSLLQLYEPLVESVGQENDQAVQLKLCDNVEEMLVRANWRQQLIKMRSEMPNSDGQTLPLAEIIIQAQSSQVIEAMRMVTELARENFLRSAMDEAFNTLLYAPAYLPLHILMADLLIKDDHKIEAITKLNAVATAYSVRGEAAQATKILRQIIQLSPMDLSSRTRLIEQLVARGKDGDAIHEYIDLADIYCRLAELDMARKVFITALGLIKQPNANRELSVKILLRIADIDMQRLDWKQAIRVYGQIRTLTPDDLSIWESLIELNLRLALIPQAQTEMESFITYWERKKPEEIIPFLRKLLTGHSEKVIIHRILADQYHKNGQTIEAIAQLDLIGDKLMEAGDKAGLAAVVNQILLLNPPNADDYRKLLTQM